MAAAKAKAVRKDKKKEQTALKEKKPLKMDYKCVTLPYLIHMTSCGLHGSIRLHMMQHLGAATTAVEQILNPSKPFSPFAQASVIPA